MEMFEKIQKGELNFFFDNGKKTVPAFASEEATTPYYMNADPPSAKETWSYNSHKPVWLNEITCKFYY
jgi:hypothetical protein